MSKVFLRLFYLVILIFSFKSIYASKYYGILIINNTNFDFKIDDSSLTKKIDTSDSYINEFDMGDQTGNAERYNTTGCLAGNTIPANSDSVLCYRSQYDAKSWWYRTQIKGNIALSYYGTKTAKLNLWVNFNYNLDGDMSEKAKSQTGYPFKQLTIEGAPQLIKAETVKLWHWGQLLPYGEQCSASKSDCDLATKTTDNIGILKGVAIAKIISGDASAKDGFIIKSPGLGNVSIEDHFGTEVEPDTQGY
jgi:hypothetical protein